MKMAAAAAGTMLKTSNLSKGAFGQLTFKANSCAALGPVRHVSINSGNPFQKPSSEDRKRRSTVTAYYNQSVIDLYAAKVI
jgi:hypothetical protein